MECNMRYFQRFEFKSNFECFSESNEIVFYMNGELFSKLKRVFFPFLDPCFYILGRPVKQKYRTFFRMALRFIADLVN